jgi:UDPglucose 6-dehydrogenase/GDP-mannose 6-dehydrogenase
MKISIIGTGYVGLVTGVCLAERGHSVLAVDLDKKKVESINTGKTPIYEPGLPELLKKNIGNNFWATMDLADAVRRTELTFIAVGTPFDGKEIDLTFIRNAAAEIGASLREKPAYHVVIVKSTVVPGTTDGVVRKTLEKESGKKAGVDFGLGTNPEFLSEGSAVADFMRPDRIILGGIDERTQDALAEVYASFEGVPMLRTSPKTAEAIKYVSNALMATAISFSNEIAQFCSDSGGIDCVEVMKGVHLMHYLTPFTPHGRVRAPIASFYEAGPGFGGSCFPKDVKALIAAGDKAGTDMKLLKEVIEINEGQPWQMLQLLKKGLGRSVHLRGIPVAVLGLAFKPETDDIRESPAFPLIDLLLTSGAEVIVYDPVALEGARKRLEGRKVAYASSLEEALLRANALALVTSWKEFEEIPALLEKLDREPVVVDGRRMLDKCKVKNYFGIGL